MALGRELNFENYLSADSGLEQESHVPLLLMSAQNDEELVLEGLARGAADFVFKPVNQRVPLSKLRVQLARKDNSDQIAFQRQRLLELQQETAREALRCECGSAQHPWSRGAEPPEHSLHRQDDDITLLAYTVGG